LEVSTEALDQNQIRTIIAYWQCQPWPYLQ
jgi:hypothetical protein